MTVCCSLLQELKKTKAIFTRFNSYIPLTILCKSSLKRSMQTLSQTFLRWHYFWDEEERGTRIKHFQSIKAAGFFGGPCFIFVLYTERIKYGGLEFGLDSWKSYLSKHILIKIVLLLFLHQFTESNRNFLLLETQFLTDGEKGVGTWRKYHNQVTWQPCGERFHPKGRCAQENENKIYRRNLHCIKK